MNVAIDIGGTNIRVTVANETDNINPSEIVQFPNSPDYETNIRNLTEVIGSLATDVTAIGVSTPGSFNDDGTVMVRSTNMPHWVGERSINSRLIDAFGCEVVVANDTETAALGEAKQGQDREPFFYINFGTGISGARVSYDSSRPIAKRVSADEQAKIFTHWQSGKSIEAEFGRNIEELNDDEKQVVMDRFINNLEDFLRLVGPKRIVFGGAVAVKQWDLISKTLDEFKKTHLEYSDTEFSLAVLRENAGLYGALALLG